MIINKKKKVTVRRCKNGHSDWSEAKHCTTCGEKIHKVKEDMSITACDQCGKEIDIFMPPFPVLFCPHCGAPAGEVVK